MSSSQISSQFLNKISSMDKENHIVIGSILRKYNKIKLNENKNGIMINVSTIPDEAIEELTKYLEYIDTQQIFLQKVEKEKDDCKQFLNIEIK
jgi:hypothetical protein